MEKIKISGVDEYLYQSTLSNGLRIYLLPNNKVKNFYITFNTKYGSKYTEFKKTSDKKYKVTPNGVAHFLEHLTFKMENGEDASDYFADLGSSSNAYTSHKLTCYEVYAYDNFKENLETLLDFVQTPCYDEKVVEAEKGIICEEVKMYDDQPETKLIFGLYQNALHKDHAKYLVTGSEDDVNSTTLKDIENAYNTFYHPSNMFVIITGNFNSEEALAIIEANQNKKEFKKKFKIDINKEKESDTVVKEFESIDMDIETEKVSIGIKIPRKAYTSLNLSYLEERIYINMITNSMFGRSSKVKDRLVSGNIITDGLYVHRDFLDDHVLITILAETPYPDRYIEIMKEEINNIDIDEEDLERKKRVAISNLIRSYDDIEEVNLSIQSDIINFDKPINDLYEVYNKLNITKAKKIISKLNTKNISILVINKKEK